MIRVLESQFVTRDKVLGIWAPVMKIDKRVNYNMCKTQSETNKKKKVLFFGVHFPKKTDVVFRMYNTILKDNWGHCLSPYHRCKGMFQAEVDTQNRL